MNDTKKIIEITVNKIINSNPINPIQFMDGYTSNNSSSTNYNISDNINIYFMSIL